MTAARTRSDMHSAYPSTAAATSTSFRVAHIFLSLFVSLLLDHAFGQEVAMDANCRRIFLVSQSASSTRLRCGSI